MTSTNITDLNLCLDTDVDILINSYTITNSSKLFYVSYPETLTCLSNYYKNEVFISMLILFIVFIVLYFCLLNKDSLKKDYKVLLEYLRIECLKELYPYYTEDQIKHKYNYIKAIKIPKLEHNKINVFDIAKGVNTNQMLLRNNINFHTENTFKANLYKKKKEIIEKTETILKDLDDMIEVLENSNEIGIDNLKQKYKYENRIKENEKKNSPQVYDPTNKYEFDNIVNNINKIDEEYIKEYKEESKEDSENNEENEEDNNEDSENEGHSEISNNKGDLKEDELNINKNEVKDAHNKSKHSNNNYMQETKGVNKLKSNFYNLDSNNIYDTNTENIYSKSEFDYLPPEPASVKDFYSINLRRRHVYVSPFIYYSIFNSRYTRIFSIYFNIMLTYFILVLLYSLFYYISTSNEVSEVLNNKYSFAFNI